MYYGKSSSSRVAITKQRAVSRKIMTAIDNQKYYEEKNESRRVRWKVNSYWLKKLIDAVEMEFSNEPDVLCHLRENVFVKWEKYKYNRDFYLAPTDIYRQLETYTQKYKERVELLVSKIRKEKEEADEK